MEKLTFGMGPAALGPGMERLRGSLSRLLTRAFDQQVDVTAVRTYADLFERIAWGDLQMAWLPPAVFIRARDRFDVTLMAASVRMDESRYHGVLFTREDATFETLEDLRGTTAAWVDRESCGGFLFPRLALMEQGIEPRRLFSGQFALGSHAAVVQAVVSKEVDVGATYVHVIGEGDAERVMSAGWSDAGTGVPMRVLLRSRPIPSDVICCTTDVPIEVEARLRRALYALHEQRAADQVLGPLLQVRRFQPASLSDYDVVRAAFNVANSRIRRPRTRRPKP